MARPGRPERNRAARSFRQLRRFHRGINSNKVFGTHTVKALSVADHFLETELEKLRAAVSTGYAQGKSFEAAKTLPRDRKDWYD
jgi:hypothetical protein